MNVVLKLTAAGCVARPAKISVDLDVSLCAPDSVAILISPGAGAVGRQPPGLTIALQSFHLPCVGIGGTHLNILCTAEAVVVGQRTGS